MSSIRQRSLRRRSKSLRTAPGAVVRTGTIASRNGNSVHPAAIVTCAPSSLRWAAGSRVDGKARSGFVGTLQGFPGRTIRAAGTLTAPRREPDRQESVTAARERTGAHAQELDHRRLTSSGTRDTLRHVSRSGGP